MRSHLALLLAALLGGSVTAAGTDDKSVRDEAANFEVAVPPEKAADWDKVVDDKRQDIKAHFKTEFTDTEPLATCDVQVIVFPLRKELTGRGLDAIASQWASLMEGSLANPRDLKEEKATLGGQEAYFRDIKGDLMAGSGPGHVTWHITRMGKFIYVFHVIRTNKAVGDDGLEGEVGKIRESFKFLKEIKVEADPKAKGDPSGPAGAGAGPEKAKGPDPELLVREEKKIEFWRFKCVKPEGLLEIPPEKFDDYDRNSHVVAKFERSVEQNRIMIYIYAQGEKSQQYSIAQLAESYLKNFKQNYNEKSRLPEEIEKDYKKFPLAKEAIRMRLVGRRTVPEVQVWYLAQCKNGRQYQIQIHLWGAEGEKFFKNQIDEFMKSFKPYED